MRFISVSLVAALLSLAAPLAAEPPAKPAFLQQDDNADIAYCFVLLKDGRYIKPKDFDETVRYLSTAAYLHMILEERSGKTWDALEPEIMPWTTKAIEDDIATTGAPRLSAQACLDLADALQKKRS